MTMIKRKPKPQFLAQRGYAMLGIIAAVGVAATAVVVTSLSTTALRNEQGRNTSSALALAKQALIASAASSNTRPGSLPCPDIDNDGQSDPLSGACTKLIGRLPWQTLGLPDLRDTGGERLWYALSQQFNDAGNVLNSNTTGELNITGTISAGRVAAIVFAPGAPVNGQIRDAEQINSVSQYIESYVTPASFSTSEAGPLYNDQLIAISTADIFLVVARRVARELQNTLQTYFTTTAGKLPWYAPACTGSVIVSCPTVNPLPALPSPAAALPAAGTAGYLPTDDPKLNAALPHWFSANNWNSVITYRVDSDCAAGLPTCGAAFAGYTVGGSDGVLIGFSGGTATTGTKAVLSFSGANTAYTNYQTTVLKAAVQ
jgi:hypothetical protein